MSLRPLRALSLALLIASVSACTRDKSELSGKVTYKGSPLSNGEVHLKASNGVEVSGEIKSDGTFTVVGIPQGSYQVEIKCIDEKAANEYFIALTGRSKTPGDPIGPDGKPRPKGSPLLEMEAFSKIPAKFGSYATSGLTVEVKESKAKKDFPLD